MAESGGNGNGGNWHLGWDARTLVLVAILAVFVISSVADIVVPGYDPPGYLWPGVMGIAGVWFGVDYVRSKRSGGGG